MTFKCNANFKSAVFSKLASFNHAEFIESAFFDSATFSDDGINLSATFRDAIFLKLASFQGSDFAGGADFANATFKGAAAFGGASFSRVAGFKNVAFADSAWFPISQFFCVANFDNAAFAEDAVFNCVAFGSHAFFKAASFAADADFRGAGRSLVIHGYDQRRSVDNSVRESVGRFLATDAVFLGNVDFSNRDIAEGPDGPESDFSGAQFFGLVRFHDADLHRGINFASAAFEQALEKGRMEEPACAEKGKEKYPEEALKNLARTEIGFRPDDPEENSVNRASIAKKQTEWDADYVNWRRDFLKRRCEEADSFNANEKERSGYFRALEDCFRTLKQFNEERRDRLEEARFFRLELLARSERAIPGRPWGDQFATWCYWWLSDFGTSIFRPFLIALASVPLFAIVYAMMGAWFDRAPNGADLMEALVYSSARLFPFGPWAEPDACSAIGQMMGLKKEDVEPCAAARNYNYLTPFVLGLVATFQSLLAIALFFLAGLALRRRFQID